MQDIQNLIHERILTSGNVRFALRSFLTGNDYIGRTGKDMGVIQHEDYTSCATCGGFLSGRIQPGTILCVCIKKELKVNTEFVELLRKMKEIHEKKGADYAAEGKHYENFERAAIVSSWFNDPVDKVFAILITVKLARLATLTNSTKPPNNESIDDTHEDLATYSTLWASRSKTIRKSEYILEPNQYHAGIKKT